MTPSAAPAADLFADLGPLHRRRAVAVGEVLPMPMLEGVDHHYPVVDGLRLHCATMGSGEPLVLLHGWPQHWWSWRHVMAPLATRYRVLCPDIRGLGWSDGGDPSGYSLRRLAADVVGVLDHFGVERTRLVGHDWGSAIGYQACLDRPDRFRQYVALAGVHPWAPTGSSPRLYLRPWHIYALALLGPWATTRLGIPENALHAWRHAGSFSPAAAQAYLDAVKLPKAATATQAYYRNVVLRELPRYVTQHRKWRLSVPTLHLIGAHDPLTRGLSQSAVRFADEMTFESLAECGHFIAEEAPDTLVARLLEFLGSDVRSETTDA